MATTKRLFVLATFFLSGLAAMFSLLSLGTEKWIVAKAVLADGSNSEDNMVEYGLFKGTYAQYTAGRANYEIQMTCSFKLNICALLCGNDRFNLLEQIYNDETDKDYAMNNCNWIAGSYYYYPQITPRQLYSSGNDGAEKHFINAYVWLMTVLFLALSALMGLLSAALAVWNTASNPIEVYFSITGLYIYNAVALAFCLIYMILWGAMYNIDIIHQAGIFYTLVGTMTSDKMTDLGWSYWINFLPLVCYSASIAVLYVRDYLISKDPGQKNVHLQDPLDSAIYLY